MLNRVLWFSELMKEAAKQQQRAVWSQNQPQPLSQPAYQQLPIQRRVFLSKHKGNWRRKNALIILHFLSVGMNLTLGLLTLDLFFSRAVSVKDNTRFHF